MPEGNDWVRKLRPSAPLNELNPVCLPETWNHTVAAIGVAAAAWVIEVTQELVLLAVDPDMDDYLREDALEAVRPSTQAVVMNTLIALYRGEPVPERVANEVSVQIAGAVRRRIPLSRVLELQRATHARLSEILIEECRRLVPAPELAQALSRLSRILVDHVSTLSLVCSAAFTAEEQAWLASIDGSRGELVRALLRGESQNIDPGKTLRYELANRTHVGLILQRQSGGDDSAAESLDRVAAMLLARIGAVRQLVIPLDDHQVWAWGAFTDPRSAIVRSIGSVSGTLVAVGRPGVGLSGFRATHEAATAAARVALAAPVGHTRTRTVFFDDVRLAALLMTDVDGAASFVRDELGALGDAREAALRETVRVYLECSCSPAGAAARLNVVKNTVVYRIRRAEELLGHSVKERQGMLWAALHLLNTVSLESAASAD